MASGDRWLPSLRPVWFLLPIVGAIVAATLDPIPPHDYWWHLLFGRYIVETGQIPSSNLFLYTVASDFPFLDQPWLGQVLMYKIYAAWGHEGGIWVRNFMLLGAWSIALHAMWLRSGRAMVCGGLGLLLVMLTMPVLSVRTRMFGFVPFAVLLWTIHYAADHPKHAWVLFVNVVTTAFWANVHGTFILAPVLLGAASGAILFERILGEREHSLAEILTWVGATGATALSVAFTPSGLAIYKYVFLLSVTSNVSSSVTEWQPPPVTEPIGQVFFVTVCLFVGLLAWRRKQVRVYEALIFAAGTVLAASAERSLFWFAMASATVMVRHLPATPEESRDGSLANLGIVGALLALLVAVEPGVFRSPIVEVTTRGLARRSGDGALTLGYENATAASALIARRMPRARVFHDQALGGLLEYQLSTPNRTQVAFVDQRMEMIPQHVWDSYFAVISGDRWSQILDRWEVDVVIPRADDQWILIQRLAMSKVWTLVFVDDVHLVYIRTAALPQWRAASI